MTPNPHSRGILLSHLPAIYGESDELETRELDPRKAADLQMREELEPPPYLEQYLRPFEQILFGLGLPDQIASLQEEIDRISDVFTPHRTPEQFLPWLAGWAALTMRADLPTETRRDLLANIIPLYRIRGTRRYLEALLQLILQVDSEVHDTFPALQIGRHSTVGVDTFAGGSAAYYFRVTLKFRGRAGENVERESRLAEEVIELSKPAHTIYDLDLRHPRFQIHARSTVGVDTYL